MLTEVEKLILSEIDFIIKPYKVHEFIDATYETINPTHPACLYGGGV